MNIVSQMCAIAVMFVIIYFYVSQKKIILHTSRAFVEVWIAGMLSLFFDIFSLVAIEKRDGYLQIVPLDDYMGCHSGILVYLCGYFQKKRA